MMIPALHSFPFFQEQASGALPEFPNLSCTKENIKTTTVAIANLTAEKVKGPTFSIPILWNANARPQMSAPKSWSRANNIRAFFIMTFCPCRFYADIP